ncbi:hypothetical protein B0I31_12416 [Saccharothrix carnea]|uniref:Ketoreductase domain-containing protein n=1 Tax=Saccharothrix carnea TaxID=1280637 RepID=A0A2P8HQY6_SACCR|nr:SDR family oxidoreductase [Saccharothrix carnea]PSL48629.1 hypothetical protein B0I31_12416 [Saccharothrix carnea]
MSRYADKKAVVIGGTHGMGLAIAAALLDEGAAVVATGRDETNVDKAGAELGERAVVVRSDVTSMGDIAALGELVAERFGRFHYLFVNVGTAVLEPIVAVTEESYDRQFAVNTKGAFFTVQRLLPLMEDGGAMVFTSSIADEGGQPTMGVYSATKAALFSFAQVLASELLPRRIRVNAVSPGFIDTPSMGVPGLTAEQRTVLQAVGDEMTPMKRHGSAEEVARAALFLAADATFTTGVKLPVDGGLGERLQYPQF